MSKRPIETIAQKREQRSRTKSELSMKTEYVEVHEEGEVAYFGWYYPEREMVDGEVVIYCVDERGKQFRARVMPSHLKPSKYGFMQGRDSSILDCEIARALRTWIQVPYSDDPNRSYKAAVIRSDEAKATVITKDKNENLEINTFATAREIVPKGYEGGKWKVKYGKCQYKVEMNELLASIMADKQGTMVVLDDQQLRTTHTVGAKNPALRFIVPNPIFDRLVPDNKKGLDILCIASDLEELMESKMADEMWEWHAYLDFTRERDYALPLIQRFTSALVRGKVIAGTFCIRHLNKKQENELPQWLMQQIAVPHMRMELVHSRVYRNGGRMFSFIVVVM